MSVAWMACVLFSDVSLSRNPGSMLACTCASVSAFIALRTSSSVIAGVMTNSRLFSSKTPL